MGRVNARPGPGKSLAQPAAWQLFAPAVYLWKIVIPTNTQMISLLDIIECAHYRENGKTDFQDK